MSTPDHGRRPPQHQLHIVFLNWRDTTNPEGGGSERYVENVAHGLVEAGHRVTIVCAAHDRAPADEVRDGVRFVRRGSKVGVYPAAAWALLSRRLGAYDAVVDVQNGVPFLSRLVTRKPVVVLVHHVHREQWPVVYGRRAAAVGWWVESRLAPFVYRRSPYVAVSEATRRELGNLGVDDRRITVVHNGTETVPPLPVARARRGSLVAVGRLVPHKRVEHALASVKALRREFPDVTLTVVGDGWWADQLHVRAAQEGVTDLVTFTGFVDDTTKHRILSESQIHLMPSLKEGWGISVMEAASHGVPTVAYRSAGGVSESVLDGMTGLLVADDQMAFTAAIRRLLMDDELRAELGEAAQLRAVTFTWEQTAKSFWMVLNAALSSTARDRGRN
jgi:glycosyltransferase involved in cell wall biosynthesis